MSILSFFVLSPPKMTLFMKSCLLVMVLWCVAQACRSDREVCQVDSDCCDGSCRFGLCYGTVCSSDNSNCTFSWECCPSMCNGTTNQCETPRCTDACGCCEWQTCRNETCITQEPVVYPRFEKFNFVGDTVEVAWASSGTGACQGHWNVSWYTWSNMGILLGDTQSLPLNTTTTVFASMPLDTQFIFQLCSLCTVSHLESPCIYITWWGPRSSIFASIDVFRVFMITIVILVVGIFLSWLAFQRRLQHSYHHQVSSEEIST